MTTTNTTALAVSPLPEDPWLTARAAASYAGCHIVTVRRAIADGKLEAARRGTAGHWHMRRSAVDAWMRGEAPQQPARRLHLVR